jgi:hypothetical protein
MPRRSILTERQRASLLDLPTDEVTILHHYTLADDDIEHIRVLSQILLEFECGHRPDIIMLRAQQTAEMQ